MKRLNPIRVFRTRLPGKIPSGLTLLAVYLLALPVPAQDSAERKPALAEEQFHERLRGMERLRDRAERTREANGLLREGWFSSLQVRALARTFDQEDARYEFVLAAYPRTVDPENFYEVYDAFTSFSKVFRLHDEIQQRRNSGRPEGRVAVQPVSDEAMADIIKAIRSEGLEDTKKAVASQLFSGRRRFLSRHIHDILRQFAFDDTRLEVAKLAYNSVVDPENYYLVNQAFSFSTTKESLARYIESRRAERPPGPRP